MSEVEEDTYNVKKFGNVLEEPSAIMAGVTGNLNGTVNSSSINKETEEVIAGQASTVKVEFVDQFRVKPKPIEEGQGNIYDPCTFKYMNCERICV